MSSEKEMTEGVLEAYKKLLDFMTKATPDHFKAVAMETARSNPEFFISALEKNGYSLSDDGNNVTTEWGFNIFKDGVKKDNVRLTIDQIKEIVRQYDYHNGGKKVNAIKRCREITGKGLYEAKAVCDYILITSDVVDVVSVDAFFKEENFCDRLNIVIG